jgi:hypothetical protein
MVGKFESYVIVSRAFVQRQLTGLEFETVFLSVFRGEGDRFRSDLAEAVRALFDAVEAYCDDSALRDPGDLDEDGLRAAATEFLRIVDDPN